MNDKYKLNVNSISEIKAKIDEKCLYGHPGFYDLLIKIADLHSRKNHDYAGAGDPLRNFHKCEAMGFSAFEGVMIRLTDKWSRLESFMKQGVMTVKDESVIDTLMDNAVYSLLAILLHEEGEKKEKGEKDE